MICSFLSAVLLLSTSAADLTRVHFMSDQVLEEPRNISHLPRTFGPDGPWNAIGVFTEEDAIRDGVVAPMWPYGAQSGYGSIVPSRRDANGNIFLATPASDKPLLFRENDTFYCHGLPFTPLGYYHSTTFSDTGLRVFMHGYTTTTLVSMINLTAVGYKFNPLALHQHSINAAVGGYFRLQNGSSYPAYDVGLLDLFLAVQSFKTRGVQTSSWSFGLHIGAAGLGQSGSMHIGGYEQNRVLEPVGLSLGESLFFLVDVLLGVQKGATPFNQTGNIGVYRGVPSEEVGAGLTARLGGPPNAATVQITSSLPYIFLPKGTCEAIAAHLPVSMNDNGFYIWNTSDPQHHWIVSSPAYLAFVIADNEAQNVTIKVPFRVLNLTLEPPIVGSPTAYFPCRTFKTFNTYEYWLLGRAFLQAAFLGGNVRMGPNGQPEVGGRQLFLAQAPSPGKILQQTVSKTIWSGAETFEPLPIDNFEKSWDDYWTPLPDPDNEGQPDPGRGGTTLIRAVVAAVAGVTLVGGGFLFFKRYKTQSNGYTQVRQDNDDDDVPLELLGRPTGNGLCELDAFEPAQEVGAPLSHEADQSFMIHEAPNEAIYHEASTQTNWDE